MLVKGRLYCLRKDGTKDSIYLNIKHKNFLFGSSEYCTVRIYIEGIFPEHCILTIGDHGKAYLEPLHPLAIILVNGIKIKCKTCLEDKDVIKILTKRFLFSYPFNSLSSSVSVERPLVLYHSKQDWEISHPISEPRAPEKLICMIESDVFTKTPECLLKIMLREPVNVSYAKINALLTNSFCSDKTLIKYRNRYVEESLDWRRKFAFKLYQFFSLIRELLNRNEECIYDLLPILKSVWKCNFARAKEDILFLPLKFLYFKFLNKAEITAHRKSLHDRINSYTPKNLFHSCDTMSAKNNNSKNELESSNRNYRGNSKHDRQKQNQESHRMISVSYKKRVSLAVKRYNLRKKRSIIMSNSAGIGSDESIKLPDVRENTNGESIGNNSDEQDVQNNVTTKRKRCCYKKEKEELQDKRKLRIKHKVSKEVAADTFEKQNITSEPTKVKRKNKKTEGKKTDLNSEKENVAQLIDNSSGKPITVTKTRKQKQAKEKESSDNGGLKNEIKTKFTNDSPRKQNNQSEFNEPKSKKENKKKKETSLGKTDSCKSFQEYITQEVSYSQRITRSMAKKHR
ncbi:hypothetical protein HNY73_011460 [Argiope bruennichi]|uniref:FHA domain-containing protein n=2 Tax=Argiope bruennichi TaxID=94029 RepID=A0A8T0F9A9_ARGBR|nr:hypothetical protein HNY73_011460 [Argiope bruennichi]